MEKVILIMEESHGQIGIANNYCHAAKFLIKHGWLDECTTLWDGKNHREVREILGTEWEDILLYRWDMEKFNEFFQDVFYLYPEEVYDGE